MFAAGMFAAASFSGAPPRDESFVDALLVAPPLPGAPLGCAVAKAGVAPGTGSSVLGLIANAATGGKTVCIGKNIYT
jgi:hypothetical protein